MKAKYRLKHNVKDEHNIAEMLCAIANELAVLNSKTTNNQVME